MAKYTVNHSCGHTQTHELFGSGKDRERRIAWLKTTDCKECWIASRKEDRKTPITAEVIYNVFSHGVYLAVTGGDTYPIKDALKSAGCRWMEYQDNNDILGVKAPRKAWMIKVDPDNVDETTAAIQKLFDAGVTRIDDTTNPLTAAIAARLGK
jgi:hypothetical protein